MAINNKTFSTSTTYGNADYKKVITTQKTHVSENIINSFYDKTESFAKKSIESLNISELKKEEFTYKLTSAIVGTLTSNISDKIPVYKENINGILNSSRFDIENIFEEYKDKPFDDKVGLRRENYIILSKYALKTVSNDNESIMDIIIKYFSKNKITDGVLYFSPIVTFSYIPTVMNYNYFDAIKTFIDAANNAIDTIDMEEVNNPEILYLYNQLSKKNSTVLFRKYNLSDIHNELLYLKNFKYSKIIYDPKNDNKDEILSDIFRNNMYIEDYLENKFYDNILNEILESFDREKNNEQLENIEFNFNKYINGLELPTSISEISLDNFKYNLFKYYIISKNKVINEDLNNFRNVLYNFYNELTSLKTYLDTLTDILKTELNGKFVLSD